MKRIKNLFILALSILMAGVSLFAHTSEAGSLPTKSASESPQEDFWDTPKIPGVETEDAIYYFEFDNTAVTEGTFSVEDTTLNLLITGNPPQNGKDVYVVRAFSTLQKYLDYGSNNSIPLGKAHTAEQDLSRYAETSGAIDEEASSGVVPKSYIDYVTSYTTTHSLVLGGTTIFNDNCSGTGTGPLNGALIIINGFVPKLIWPFNDNVERFINGPISPYVLNKVYARTWFRTKMISVWLPYNAQICFQGPLAGLANRASSWISIL